jgi:hypothetical protein
VKRGQRQRVRGGTNRAADWIESLQNGQLFSINPGNFSQFTLAGSSVPAATNPGTPPLVNEMVVTRVQGHILLVPPVVTPLSNPVVNAFLAHIGFVKVPFDVATGALSRQNPGGVALGDYTALTRKNWLHPILRKYVICAANGPGVATLIPGSINFVAEGREILMPIDLPFNCRLGSGDSLVMSVSNDNFYSNIAINFAMFLRVKVTRVA